MTRTGCKTPPFHVGGHLLPDKTLLLRSYGIAPTSEILIAGSISAGTLFRPFATRHHPHTDLGQRSFGAGFVAFLGLRAAFEGVRVPADLVFLDAVLFLRGL